MRQHPDHPGMLYSLACYEALAGRPDDALAHLRRAVELDGKIDGYAQNNGDLESIRSLPGFPAA